MLIDLEKKIDTHTHKKKKQKQTVATTTNTGCPQNIWDTLKLKKCLLFIWNSYVTRHPVFYLATYVQGTTGWYNKTLSSGIRSPGFKSQLCHLYHWTSSWPFYTSALSSVKWGWWVLIGYLEQRLAPAAVAISLCFRPPLWIRLLILSPPSRHSSHSGLMAFPGSCHTGSCVKVFATITSSGAELFIFQCHLLFWPPCI